MKLVELAMCSLMVERIVDREDGGVENKSSMGSRLMAIGEVSLDG